MTPEEAVAKFKEYERKQDKIRAATLLKDIPKYHKWYAETKNSRFLDAAKLFGGELSDLYKKWTAPNPS